MYLLYSIAGKQGIAMARLEWNAGFDPASNP